MACLLSGAPRSLLEQTVHQLLEGPTIEEDVWGFRKLMALVRMQLLVGPTIEEDGWADERRVSTGNADNGWHFC